jgi:hypothetical protein
VVNSPTPVFTNTFDEQESQALHDRYHIPASGKVFWESAPAAHVVTAVRVVPEARV